MKKLLIVMSVLIGMMAGAMMLSAFTTPKQDCSQVEMNDGWKLFRENVPYCDGDKGTCEGYGYVYVNTDTYQVAFSLSRGSNKYDLSYYDKKDGYNMRFYYGGKYYYISIYIPDAVFRD